METFPRSSRNQPDDMPPTPASAYEPPPEKDKISARVAALTKKKLLVITEYWKAQRRVDKKAEVASLRISAEEKKQIVEDAVKDVDLTYTIDRLLKRVADEELTQWGGYPDTPEKMEATIEGIEKQSK